MFICIFDGTINWIFKLCLPKYRALWYTWNTGIYIYMCVCVGIICFYFIFMKNLLIWREIGQFEQRSVIIGEFANIGENLLTWWKKMRKYFFFFGGGRSYYFWEDSEKYKYFRSGAKFRDLISTLGPDNSALLLLLALTEQKILIHSLRNTFII